MSEEAREQWLFTAEALLRSREQSRDHAAQTLKASQGIEAGSGKAPRAAAAVPREPPRPLSLEEESALVLYYAQKLPELCSLCGAPSEVCWTAVLFYRRFFAVRSPMAFDPLLIMFTCVHVACKVEEVHEITLDKLLSAADLGSDASVRTKVCGLELPLLEGVGFQLMVEPKPDSALQMLAEELKRAAGQGSAPHGRAPSNALSESAWQELVQRAESLVFDLAVRTDAVLCWPTSVLITAALAAVLDMQVGRPLAGEPSGAAALSDTLVTLLGANLETEPRRAAMRQMLEAIGAEIQELPNRAQLTEEAVRETRKSARRCHRAFERLREAATERHEVHRKERKRRWREMKGAAPAPPSKDLQSFARSCPEDPEEFFIRRPKEDNMEED